MFKVLLVSPEKETFSDLASALVQHSDVELSWVESGEIALNIASEANPDLIITDEMLEDMNGLDFAGRLLAVNPMINCATVSCLSPEKFHEKSEGMGVMAQLPARPDKAHGEDLLRRLRNIKNLLSGAKKD
jgi:CheY-like chemotaxis protein